VHGSVPRWLVYVLLVPATIGVGVLAAVFFVAAFAVLAALAVAMGVAVWYVRRPPRRRKGDDTIDGHSVVVESKHATAIGGPCTQDGHDRSDASQSPPG
jgi:hypothetical protein